tara:strand:+ start:880 stop:1512 length:633 start_codon:yes stop_codon:yes gene_type:complete
MYSIKEIFYTLQGEGANAGRAAIFCRFTGCNLWSGREKDRDRAICKFCDTDFVGTDGTMGGQYKTAEALVEAMQGLWPDNQKKNKFVVLTGGEPLLQVDSSLIKQLHEHDFEVAVETNGTIPLPSGIDWVCVSPKRGAKLRVTKGNEIKIVYPQIGLRLVEFENMSFDHFFLQPMDSVDRVGNTNLCVNACLENPKWRLSVQTHKEIGIR